MTTDEESEYAQAITEKKNAIEVYINDPDSSRVLIAMQVLISALVTNAASLDNLTVLLDELQERLDP